MWVGCGPIGTTVVTYIEDIENIDKSNLTNCWANWMDDGSLTMCVAVLCCGTYGLDGGTPFTACA